jgi:hypothetical protein
MHATAEWNGIQPKRSQFHDGFLWAWKDFDFDNFALGFCGVLSTRTIGPFVACDWVVAAAAVAGEATISTSASSFVVAGSDAFGPSLRRFLKTFDMLTSRCRTLRGLDSVRRSPAAASCSRETERERERDCDRAASRLCLVLSLLVGFACESKSIGGSGCPWTSSSSSASDSESDEDVHCGIRNSFLRKSLYCSGSFSENLKKRGGRFESSYNITACASPSLTRAAPRHRKMFASNRAGAWSRRCLRPPNPRRAVPSAKARAGP